MTTARLETVVQHEILAALGAEPDLILLKNSVGQARHVSERTGDIFFVPYGLGTSSPDLVGILGPWGRWFCLEVKRPGEEATPEQAHLHEVWRRWGAFVEVVTSASEARAALERARKESAER